MSTLTQQECQTLIDSEHEWTVSEIIGRDKLVRNDSYEKRTFKEVSVSVFAEQHPMILKEIITKYEIGDFCSLHKDNSWGDVKPGWRAYAVWITPLNNDYEGGELYYKSKLIEQKVGEAIKSDRRIRHEITKVTKGTRYSLVSWLFRKV